jgi:cell division protein FtsQ
MFALIWMTDSSLHYGFLSISFQIIADSTRAVSRYIQFWRFSRPCSGVMKPGNDTNRLLNWEDEAPAVARVRRVRQDAPQKGRILPGMPLDLADPDDNDPSDSAAPRFKKPRFSGPRGPWWRPAGTLARVALGLGVFAVVGGLTTTVVLAKNYLCRDSHFRISGAANIQAAGLTEVSRAEMLPVFGEDIGRNIFFVPLTERRKQLEEIPWVERATVMRLLPDQIRVSVVERQPVAFAHQGGLVDANGVLLDMPAQMMAQRHYSFPVVSGINPNDPPAARKARMAVYQRLVGELDSNSQHNSSQISEIDLTNPEDALVTMPEQGGDILAHFGQDQFLVRYQRYKTHINEWRQQFPKLSSVDLRYDQQVVLDMNGGAADAQPVSTETAEQKPAATEEAKKPEAAKAEVKPDAPALEKSAKAVKAAAKATNKKDATKPAKLKKAAAPSKKKHADAKRAALNVNHHKTVPALQTVAPATEGQ